MVQEQPWQELCNPPPLPTVCSVSFCHVSITFCTRFVSSSKVGGTHHHPQEIAWTLQSNIYLLLFVLLVCVVYVFVYGVYECVACVYVVCVCVYVVCVSVCLCVCGGRRFTLCVIPRHCPVCLLRQRPSLAFILSRRLNCLATKLQGSCCLYLHSTEYVHYTQLFHRASVAHTQGLVLKQQALYLLSHLPVRK